MGKAGEKQKRCGRQRTHPKSERSTETVAEIGTENLSDMWDKFIGEMGRNAAFPPCQGCGLAMMIGQITPTKIQPTDDRTQQRNCQRG
jgi:hypothetical protein